MNALYYGDIFEILDGCGQADTVDLIYLNLPSKSNQASPSRTAPAPASPVNAPHLSERP